VEEVYYWERKVPLVDIEGEVRVLKRFVTNPKYSLFCQRNMPKGAICG